MLVFIELCSQSELVCCVILSDYIGSTARKRIIYISLPKPFASGNVNKCQRFKICGKANEFRNNATMALKLPMFLEGEALAVRMELTEGEQKDYEEAKMCE